MKQIYKTQCMSRRHVTCVPKVIKLTPVHRQILQDLGYTPLQQDGRNARHHEHS